MPKTETLSVDLLSTDAGTQARIAISEDTVEAYADIIADSPDWPLGPLDVFHDGNEYLVADGFHRTMAAHRSQRASVPCRVHRGTARDARIFGMTANDKHGLRMSQADKRACVEWLLDNEPKMSQRDLAKTAGVTTRTVRRIIDDRKPDPPQPPPVRDQAETPEGRTMSAEQMYSSSDDDESETTEPATVSEDTSNASVVLDTVGRPVPPEMRDSHAAAASIQAAARKLDGVLREIVDLRSQPGGEYLELSALQVMIADLKKRLRGATYWSECPRCHGQGCVECNDLGWWPDRHKGKVTAADKQWLGVE